jgi:hypothetical protein
MVCVSIRQHWEVSWSAHAQKVDQAGWNRFACAGATTIINATFELVAMTSFLKAVFGPSLGTTGRAPSFNDFSLHVGRDGVPH